MRFEVAAAYTMGAALPALETCRRGLSHWLIGATTFLLLLGWAYVSGMMFGSFWGHLEETLRGVYREPGNTTMLLFKAAIWTTAVISLLLSLKHCNQSPPEC